MRTQPLTSLKRRAARIIAELGPTAEPVLITQHGKPAAYLMGVEALDALNRRVDMLEGIARGERAIEDGRVVTHAEARTRMQRWLESGAIHAMSGERQFQRGIRKEWDA